MAYDIPNQIEVLKIENGRILKLNSKNEDFTEKKTGIKNKLRKNKILTKVYGYLRRKILDVNNYIKFDKKEFESNIKQLSPNVIINNNVINKHYYHDVFESVCPSIICLHSAPKYLFNSRGISLRKAEKLFKNRHCVAVSKESATELKDMFPSVKSSSSIYNIISKESILDEANIILNREVPKKYIIYVGTICERKRVDRIVMSLTHLDESVSLVICGEGPLKDQIKTLVESLHLESRVYFFGFIRSPFYLIKNAECLVLSSDSEGLPTVLIESLMLNTPVVSTDCKTGPKEIMTGSMRQFLVDMQNEKEIPRIIAEKIVAASSLTGLDYNNFYAPFTQKVVVSDWLDKFKEIGV
ncbi:glycosyltransferase [Vibrio sp. Vb1554]|uniref:glycosyltransferase n=1 Tax=Vibrio sp. Vb1554 TaxID=3074642 RepID=UPI0029677AD4|nr:glycosyltransferase [Vibrio sp. Vb1554]MDW3048655.1 glycosyltransferase [Vibrio sp. Vb1554]